MLIIKIEEQIRLISARISNTNEKKKSVRI